MLYYYREVTHSVFMNLIRLVKFMIADDFLKLLSVEYLDL